MFKHYLKTTVRSLLRSKLYTAINILGLGIGLALCLVVVGHIGYEMSFENFHENRDRIYRVEAEYSSEDDLLRSARVMGPLGAALTEEIPEVAGAAVFRVESLNSLKPGEERIRVVDTYRGAGYTHGKHVIFAGPGFFDVFTFRMREGNPRTALLEPFTVLITERAATEYFPNQNPIGESIEINDRFNCRITGILRDIPQNTQLYTDFIVSYASLEAAGADTRSWSESSTDYTYLLLDENAEAAVAESKIPSVIGAYLPPEEAAKYKFNLQPLKDIYFNAYTSGNRGELRPGGEKSLIFTLGFVALFILIQAIANFINLATARSSDRMKEVGVRKVFGAFRSHLIRQYLGESIAIATISMFCALLLYEGFKWVIQGVLPREMLAGFYDNPVLLLCVAGLTLLVGIIAGFYPALYLSRHSPITVLQGKVSIKSTKSVLRRALVVVQFTIAALFIFGTTVIVRQATFLTSIDLGFEKDDMMILDFDGATAAEDCRLMKNEIINQNRVLSVTATSCPPGRETYRNVGFYPNPDRLRVDMIVTKLYNVDFDFIDHFGLNITQGRDFSLETEGVNNRYVIVTESMADKLGGADLVGRKLYSGSDKFFEIVGVVEDFHGSRIDISSATASVLRINPEKYTSLAVKLPSGDKAQSISAIGTTWNNTLPSRQFTYTFLDDEIQTNYSDARGQMTMFLSLASFAILIACMGIFGLVSFTAERRTKEIGIRKVLGASVTSVVKLLSREFLVLILIANAIALPLGYMMMSGMLRGYAVRVTIGVGTFAFVIAIALFFGLATSTFQSVKAGMADPVESLRSE